MPCLIVPQHIQILQRMQHVVRRHRRLGTQILDICLGPSIHEKIDNDFLPIGTVTQQPQIGKRFLGRPELAFALGQQVGEVDEEFSEAFALVLGEG